MGTDYLRLECIYSHALERVAQTVGELLEAAGWTRGEPTSARPRERSIALAQFGAWTVIDELDHPAPPVWADVITRELGGTGISARSWSDDGKIGIDRFESGVISERQQWDVGAGPVSVDEGFLADLLPPEARPAPRNARPDCELDSDGALVALCRRAGLPQPLDRYHDLTVHGSPRVLAFCKERRELSREPAHTVETTEPVTKNVGFRAALHVRGAERSVVAQAIAAIYGRHGYVFVPWGRPTRRVFLVNERDWCSFAELGEGGGEAYHIGWGEELSTELRMPVLRITRSEVDATTEIFERGARTARLVLANGPLLQGAESLRAFAGKRADRLHLDEAGAAAKLASLAAHLELPHPVLQGTLVAAVLPFVRDPSDD